jgi:Ca-activated chloride channel family protein
MPLSMSASAPAFHDLSTGAHMVAADGRPLPLLGVELRAHAKAGLARVTLRQQFQNPWDEPLRVRYLVPLPADAAVGGYCFELPNERIVGEIARKQDARERFERALIEGRSAALLEQQRSSVFEQEVGNIPPGALVTTELTIDQPLCWLAEGAWEWRFPTVVAPRFMGEPGRVPDAAKLNVPVLDGAVPAGATLALTIADDARIAPHSSSHALSSTHGAAGWMVGLAGEAGITRLDRDVVVRWSVAAQVPGIEVSLARREHDDCALGLLTIVPPEPSDARYPVARDVILLIDISGSMNGEPLAQARRVARALIDGLAPHDRLEMIAFASQPIRWRSRPEFCKPDVRADATTWVQSLQAGGGTHMHSAIIEALAPQRDSAQRQILVISDGQIGFEQQIIGEVVTRLHSQSRVHCVGVGHGVNRSLTRPLARAGRGIELIVAPGEDVERVVGTLLARTVEPLLVGLELEGSALFEQPLLTVGARGDLFGGAPTRIAIACRVEGGHLTLRAHTAEGTWVQNIEVPATAAGVGDPALVRHFAREQVEDIETLIAAGLAREGDARTEALGLRYGIATRMTSWIAVSTQVTVDPTAPTRTIEQPHELPAGMSAEGLGLRPAQQAGDTGRVVRNERGEIVGTDRKREPKILGFINLPSAPRRSGVTIAPASPGRAEGRATARKQRERSPEPSRSPRPIRRRASAPLPAPRDSDGGASPPAPPSPPPRPHAGDRTELPPLTRRFKSRTIPAKILLERADQLVLSFVVGRQLDWSPNTTLELRIDGRKIQVRVDQAATTANARLDAGVTVRLTLTLGFALPPGALELEVCGLRLAADR